MAPPPPPSAAYVALMASLYAVCSSTLSIVNKWALLGLPYPGLVTACQFLTTAVVVSIAGTLKYIDVEPLRKDKLMQMAPINIVFYLAIFTNGQVLKYATVETFIAFRSLTPLLVSALDTVVRGEPAPSRRTLCCLCAIALGAASYAHNDARITPAGYAWGVVYLSIIVTEMVYAKHVTATIQLSTWSLVLYQNTIALFLWPFASLISGEFQSLRLLVQTPEAESEPLMTMTTLVPLLLSCVLAIGISFSAWGTRSAVSATQFTVLGVACKLATVAINVLAWSHHASIEAQFSIIVCILSYIWPRRMPSNGRVVVLLAQIFRGRAPRPALGVTSSARRESFPHAGVVQHPATRRREGLRVPRLH